MLRHALLAAAVAACLSASPVFAQAPSTTRAAPAASAQSPAAKALHALFDEEWERGMRENPEEASWRGETRPNHIAKRLG